MTEEILQEKKAREESDYKKANKEDTDANDKISKELKKIESEVSKAH